MSASPTPTPARFWPLLVNAGLLLLLLLGYNRSLTVIMLFAMGSTAVNGLAGLVLLMLGEWRVAAWFGGVLVAMLGIAALSSLPLLFYS